MVWRKRGVSEKGLGEVWRSVGRDMEKCGGCGEALVISLELRTNSPNSLLQRISP